MELPSELGDVHIDGVDSRGVVLEQTIGEAAGGCANVKTNEARRIYGEVFESAFELQAATTGIFQVAAFHFDDGIACDLSSRLVDGSAVDPNFARKNHRLRFLLGLGEAALDEKKIQACAT